MRYVPESLATKSLATGGLGGSPYGPSAMPPVGKLLVAKLSGTYRTGRPLGVPTMSATWS